MAITKVSRDLLNTSIVDNGNATAITIDSSENVGIGTASPQAPLHVTGTIKVATGNAQGILALGEGLGTAVNVGLWRGAANNPTSDGNYLNLGGYDGIVLATGGAAIGSQTERMRIAGNNVLLTGGNDARIVFGTGGAGAAIANDANWIRGESDSLIYNAAANGSHKYEINGSEKMRIDSSGKTMIGATSPVVSCMLTVRGNYNSDRGIGIQSTTSGGDLMMFYATAQVGTITSTGGGTNYNSASDYRLKENVNYDWDATTRLKQLKPARFNWINDETNTLIDGFLAHEVEDVVSHAVRGTKDAVDENGDVEPQSIDQSKLVPLLVKTIQELEARITALES